MKLLRPNPLQLHTGRKKLPYILPRMFVGKFRPAISRVTLSIYIHTRYLPLSPKRYKQNWKISFFGQKFTVSLCFSLSLSLSPYLSGWLAGWLAGFSRYGFPYNPFRRPSFKLHTQTKATSGGRRAVKIEVNTGPEYLASVIAKKVWAVSVLTAQLCIEGLI